MANILNDDFKDFLIALNKEGVEYIVVGGYAVIFHGYNRTTGDLDVWINPTEINYQRVIRAFQSFGMGLFGMTIDRFLDTQNYDVFTFGRPPVCIEILTKVKGLDFGETFPRSQNQLFDGITVNIVDIRDLIVAKKASGRPKDMDDLEHMDKV